MLLTQSALEIAPLEAMTVFNLMTAVIYRLSTFPSSLLDHDSCKCKLVYDNNSSQNSGTKPSYERRRLEVYIECTGKMRFAGLKSEQD